MSAPQSTSWASKNEALYIGERQDAAKWCVAVVDGEPASNELVALVWGYSPEGATKRSRLIAAASELYGALADLLEAVSAADKVLRGDFYHERKAAKAALAKVRGEQS